MSYIIEDIKCDITEGGFACGPINGNVVSSIKYNDGKKSNWLSLYEIQGMPEFHLSDNDIFDDLIKEEDTDEYKELLDSTYIDEFNGINVTEYDNIFNSINNLSKEDQLLIRLIIFVTRCDFSELDDIKNRSIGKDIYNIDIPISDVEEDFI